MADKEFAEVATNCQCKRGQHAKIKKKGTIVKAEMQSLHIDP